MARKIVGRNQQEEVARLHPMTAYSRQVCIELHVLKGSGAADWFTTPPLGNRLWLLGIDIWFINPTVDVLIKGWLVITTGSNKKPTAPQVVYEWEPLLPLVGHSGTWLEWCGIRCHRHYSMRKFFQGSERRFAAYVENKTDLTDWYAHVSFEISEG